MKRFVVVVGIALGAVGCFALSSLDAHAGPKGYGGGADHALFVTFVTPSRNQHMLPDLSDPGANNRITVRFSAVLDPHGVVDEQGGLGAKCVLRDQTLAEVPAAASVSYSTLSIDPFSASRPVLPQGRYTLTLSSSVRSAAGRRLNDGARAYSTTFYVGSETAFAPALLRTSPKAGATRVAARRAVVATFDERIDLASALGAIRLEDRGTVPPTSIPARIKLARRGFAVVVAPAARTRYPQRSDVALVIAGQGSATDPSARALKEVEGHKFTRDRGPSWSVDASVPSLFHSVNGDFDDETGEFTLAFRTRGVANR